MAKSSQASESTVIWIVLAIVGGFFLSLKSCHYDDDTEKKSATAAPVEDEPSITHQILSGNQKDVLVVRSHGQEYVRIDDMVFVWRGTNLVGVYGKDGQLPSFPPTSVTNIVAP